MKIVDSHKCLLCTNIPETIEHAFIECQKTHSDAENMLGTLYDNSIIGMVISLTKKKIYKSRQKGKVTNIVQSF